MSNSQKIYKQKKRFAPRTIKTAVRASRRDAPESLKEPSAQSDLIRPLSVVTPRGRAGCRVPDAPAALCAKKGSTSAHKHSQRRHRKTRQSRTRWCYSLCRALLGEMLYCARPPTEDGLSDPVGADEPPKGITPASGAGPHGLKVRSKRRSSCATFIVGSQAHTSMCTLPCQFMATPGTAASIASHSASVTTAIRPWCGTRQRWL